MTTEPPGGVESVSDAVSGFSASRIENRVAHTSETLVKLVGFDRKSFFSAGDKRNVVSNPKKETNCVDRESDFETENDSDAESEDFVEKRDLDSVVVLGGLASGNENLNLSESDLVWGKVRSYLWWPGQVFDASLASKNAKKHFKKGNSLVVYFGDCSFAWNDVSKIKPFRQHFSEMVNQSNSADFRDAIDCALEEVSRRVEFGLSCACVSVEAYSKLKTHNITNVGIREDSRVRYGGDKLSNAVFFEPAKLVEYMKDLACFPSYDASDKMQFVINRAQLLAFQQWKGYFNFPEYETFLKSVESAARKASLSELDTDEEVSSKKRKTDYKDNDEHKQRFDFEDRADEKMKEKTLSDLTEEKRLGSRSIEKLDGKSHSDKKRKVESSESDQSEKKIKNNLQTEDSVSQNSDEENNSSMGDGNKLQKVAEPCCGIGDIPLRVETKMDSLTPTFNSCSDSNSTTKVEDENTKTEKIKHEELAERKISSPDEMLPSLHSAKTPEGIPESVTIDHSKYEEFDKFLKEISCSNLNDEFKKAVEDITGSKEETALKDCSADSRAPNALILIFLDSGSVPSEEKLNSIFNRYGPLIESETQVMKKSKRAKVVFKSGEDAKTAFSSSGKYSIFGPSLLSYKLKYVCPKAKQSNNKMTS
ncbi:unnamed protein product [Arabis nemorensis]|uniref:PWWP domain-containing protein n=1 Tax=Arabis nemorensis TaxID=586526 RepID=A0A565CHH6_9BRAS|nr:unnamed protein product [Arabis nemorensis]